MKATRVLLGVLAAALIGLGATSASAATEIQWWHAMSDALGEWVNDLAAGFNKAQADYKVVPVFKGTYTETMTGAIAAFRAHQQPHIVQVIEVGTATMMASKGAIKPVYQLMAESGEKFDPQGYLPAVAAYYTTTDGKMLSLPFNSSTPVLYYNKDAFKKAGLDPAKPPRTWPELAEDAKKLQAAGSPCGFTTEWQTWIHLENLSAWHNQPIATKENGLGGLEAELQLNGPVQVKHVQQLGEWQKTGVFEYGGRQAADKAKFYTGKCAMLTASSAAYAAVTAAAKDKFEFGIGMLPFWPDVQGAPQNTIIGGASLWVLAGHKAEEYRGVARFFNYLASPEVQAASHQRTGYLPITKAAYELTKAQGFYQKKPGTDVAILEITNKPPTANSKGLRLGSMAQVRDAMDEELEAVWAGKKPAKEALDSLVKRGNDILRQFERTNR
ncbi:MAG: sn-glycerol-3-phosphate ABC transporter substrate-binding protein UgpB [Candidatus Rokuibacteriota bacterium]|nr:MAG: sn-glycerol-3-phosphate ABC transporter substrate-binding protein UgpB [Candidatus Rokubacteria bacterium]